MNTVYQKGTATKESSTLVTFFSGDAVAEIPEITDIPLIAYQIKVVAAGGVECSGIISISGTQGGSFISEDLVIPGPGTYYSAKYYDLGTIPTITTSGLHNEDPTPTLVISPVDPVHFQSVNGSVTFSVDWIDETVEVRSKEGDITRFDSWFTTDTSLSVGDSIQYGNVEYSIEKVFAVKNISRAVDHYKVYVL